MIKSKLAITLASLFIFTGTTQVFANEDLASTIGGTTSSTRAVVGFPANIIYKAAVNTSKKIMGEASGIFNSWEDWTDGMDNHLGEDEKGLFFPSVAIVGGGTTMFTAGSITAPTAITIVFAGTVSLILCQDLEWKWELSNSCDRVWDLNRSAVTDPQAMEKNKAEFQEMVNNGTLKLKPGVTLENMSSIQWDALAKDLDRAVTNSNSIVNDNDTSSIVNY